MAELMANFDDPNIREEYVNKLQNLKQTTSVITYAADFEATIYHVGYRDGWADKFYAGLKFITIRTWTFPRYYLRPVMPATSMLLKRPKPDSRSP